MTDRAQITEILHDSPERYGLISRTLHWLMTYLLIWQFLVAVAWLCFGKGALTDMLHSAGPSHGTVGAMVLFLVLPRALWALSNRLRRPPAGPRLAGKAAKGVHHLMYLLMLVVPMLAVVRAYGTGKGYLIFGRRLIPATGREIPWMVAPADLFHSPLAWLLAILIAGHVAMALVHAIVLRDGMLRRMTGPDSPKPR